MPSYIEKTDEKRKRFSENLRSLRKKAGLTQSEAADALGISRSTYTYYELGKTVPDIFALPILCGLYNVTYEIMIDGEGK